MTSEGTGASSGREPAGRAAVLAAAAVCGALLLGEGLLRIGGWPGDSDPRKSGAEDEIPAEGGRQRGAATGAPLAALPAPAYAREGGPGGVQHDPPARIEGTACGYRIEAKRLNSLASETLIPGGMGDSSPLVLTEDGRPLKPFGDETEVAAGCGGAFRFVKDQVELSPSGSDPAAAAARTYALGLSPDLPLQTPAGTAWWLYPKSQLVFRFPGSGDVAGREATLTLAGRTPQREIRAPLVLHVLGQRVELKEEGDLLQASATIVLPAKPWEIKLVSPKKGPYLLVERLELAAGGEKVDLIAAAMNAAAKGGDAGSGGQ